MKEEKIIFQNSKGQKLVGVLYSPDSKEEYPIAIFCHGYGSSKESSKVGKLSKALAPKGRGVFAFDFSGIGESEGKFEETTLTQYMDDLKCAIDYVSTLTDKIGVIGSSLGGIVALQETAKDDRADALLLLSPVSHFPWRTAKEFANIKKWKEQGFQYTQSRRFGRLKINYSFYEDGLQYGDYSVYGGIKIPILIIHGDKDEAVPIEDSKELVKHIPNSELMILKGADHRYTNPKDYDKLIEESTNFLLGVLK